MENANVSQLAQELLMATLHSVEMPFWGVPFFAVAMWLLVTTLISWIAGHMALLARFPPVNEQLDARFRFASGYMRWTSFRNALFVGISPRGLHLAPNALFRPLFFRGIPCIPWQELTCIRAHAEGPLGWFKGSKFEIRYLDFRFTLHGDPGLSVEAKLKSLSSV
jgi:hypothetical protein